MNEIQSFSWEILNKKFAIKKIDKSFLRYGETVIPINIRTFFEIEQYTYGDIIDLELIYRNKNFKSRIIFENNFNRSKLKLSKEIHELIINNLKVNSITNDENSLKAVFFKQRKHKYFINIIMEI